MRQWFFPFVLIGILSGCQPDQQNRQATNSGVVNHGLDIDFATWPSVTKKPYRVEKVIFSACAPGSEEAFQRHKQWLQETHGPHAFTSIVVRVNSIGRHQFTERKPIPIGTIIIKEKHSDTSKPFVAVAAMIKREAGYDPTHSDWEYAYEQLVPKEEHRLERGKIDSCIGCHHNAQSDYLFRPYLPIQP